MPFIGIDLLIQCFQLAEVDVLLGRSLLENVLDLFDLSLVLSLFTFQLLAGLLRKCTCACAEHESKH
ncbi:hypothetical protein D3C87_1805040 [compost metagenome]